jgi:hypothetical protein
MIAALRTALLALLIGGIAGNGRAAEPGVAPRATAPTLVPSHGARPPFRAFVDMATFMEHVLTPAATIVWRTNGFVNDAGGEHDLSPKSEADWEGVVSGAATLAEATNALLIPGRALDKDWNRYVEALAALAERAYRAAEQRDLATLGDVSDHLDEACSSCHRHYHLE